MRLGIFAKTFQCASLEEVLDAVVDAGFHSIQFNLQSAGLSPMPTCIEPKMIERIRTETARRGIEVSALSGTFNMIHPDPDVVTRGLERLEILADAAQPMGAKMITLCTGTRDAEDMWRRHPDNDSSASWHDLIDSIEKSLFIASRRNICLGIEPEAGNVINSATKCRRLLDEFASPLLKVVFDPANLVSTDLEREPAELLSEAFDLLGTAIGIGHAKDCDPGGNFVPAGKGIVPWDLVVHRMEESSGSLSAQLILHGLGEADVLGAATFLRSRIGAVA